METAGIHEVLRLKSCQIQWNLMGSMKFYNSNLIKSNGTWWDSWGYKIQILSNPIESYGFHEILQFKSYKIQWNPMGFMKF